MPNKELTVLVCVFGLSSFCINAPGGGVGFWDNKGFTEKNGSYYTWSTNVQFPSDSVTKITNEYGVKSLMFRVAKNRYPEYRLFAMSEKNVSAVIDNSNNQEFSDIAVEMELVPKKKTRRRVVPANSLRF